MTRLDQIELPVRDWRQSRNWRRDMLGFGAEMEVPDARTVGLGDEADLTSFMHESAPPGAALGLSFTVQAPDVEAARRWLAAKGVAFEHPPQKVYWGDGAELFDPSGYRLRLWGEATMKEGG